MGVAMHLFMIAGMLWASVQEPPAPQGPAGYWKLDEATTAGQAVDSVGGVNGTYVGPPTVTATVPPANTFPDLKALSFNGTSQAVTIPNFGSFTSMTVSVWVNRSGTTGTR